MTEETDIREREGAATASSDAEGPEDGAAPAEEEGAVAAEVEELREELQSLNDQHLRLAAEFDNYRKRNRRERQTLATRLQADLVSSLLEVLDDLQRVGEADADSDAAGLLEGVRLVERKFMNVLRSAGLEALEAEGEPFDPEVMEALMTVPTPDPEKDDRVADVFQAGYRLGDTLVRPARVRVWQHDPAATDE